MTPSYNVFLTVDGSPNPFEGRFNLRLGRPSTLLCYSNNLDWSTSSYYAEVSLYYCNDSNFRSFSSPCSSFSEYRPLFGVTHGHSISNYRFLSDSANSTLQRFQIMFPPEPDPYLPSIMLRISVRTVTPSFQGYFFCRITVKPLSSTGESTSTRISDSGFVAIKPFGIFPKIQVKIICCNMKVSLFWFYLKI